MKDFLQEVMPRWALRDEAGKTSFPAGGWVPAMSGLRETEMEKSQRSGNGPVITPRGLVSGRERGAHHSRGGGHAGARGPWLSWAPCVSSGTQLPSCL